MKFTELTDVTLARLVDGFYARVRHDPLLGPVFERAIPTERWPEHLGTMVEFWSSVMLTTGRYKGNPMAVHMAVPGLEEGLFERWLALFEATSAELFAADLASVFRAKARRIAESLRLGLFYRPGRCG